MNIPGCIEKNPHYFFICFFILQHLVHLPLPLQLLLYHAKRFSLFVSVSSFSLGCAGCICLFSFRLISVSPKLLCCCCAHSSTACDRPVRPSVRRKSSPFRSLSLPSPPTSSFPSSSSSCRPEYFHPPPPHGCLQILLQHYREKKRKENLY